jgi:hypothetical protein
MNECSRISLSKLCGMQAPSIGVVGEIVLRSVGSGAREPVKENFL